MNSLRNCIFCTDLFIVRCHVFVGNVTCAYEVVYSIVSPRELIKHGIDTQHARRSTNVTQSGTEG